MRAGARRQRAARWLLLAGVVLFGLLLGTHQVGMLELSRAHWGNDFTQYWNGGSSVAAGRSPYEWLAEGRPLGLHDYHYPPLLAVLLAPLTRVLDYPAARWAWLGFSLLCLTLGVWLVWSTTGLGRSRGRALVLISCLALLPAATLAIGIGQLSPQLLLGMAAGCAAVGVTRLTLAGTIVAFGAYLKSFPALLGGYLLLRRQWRACVAALAAGLAFVAATVLVVGWEPHWTYLTAVVPAQPRWFSQPYNLSLTGFFTRLLVDNPATTPVVAASTAAKAAIALSTAVLLVASAYAIRSVRANREAETMGYALAVVAALLVSPMNGHYNLVIAALPLAVAAVRVQAVRPQYLPWLWVALVLLSLPVEFCDLWPVRSWCADHWLLQGLPRRELPWRSGWGNLLIAGPFFGLLALWGLLLRLCLEARPLARSGGATR